MKESVAGNIGEETVPATAGPLWSEQGSQAFY
jgi:hypothetical protein